MSGPGRMTLLTPRRRCILQALLDIDEPVAIRDLSEVLDIPHTTVYEFIRALSKANMLESHQRDDEPPSNAMYYGLTPHGRSLAPDLLRRSQGVVQPPRTPNTHITGLMTAMLRVLHEADRPLYGVEITRASGYAHGVVYPRLRSFVRRGWATSFTAASPVSRGAPPRIYYEITPIGRGVIGQILREERESHEH